MRNLFHEEYRTQFQKENVKKITVKNISMHKECNMGKNRWLISMGTLPPERENGMAISSQVKKATFKQLIS